MTKRIIVSLSDEEYEKVNKYAEQFNMSRNSIIQQICRKYIGLPSLLVEGDKS